MVGGQYFAGSPVIINISFASSDFANGATFKQVELTVTTTFNSVERSYPFVAEVGSDASLAFDISSALRSAMTLYDFASEVAAANSAAGGTAQNASRAAVSFALQAKTSYMLDGILYTGTTLTNAGGRAVIGAWDELQRFRGASQNIADILHTATTKPTELERVGADSVLSVPGVNNNSTTTAFSNASAQANDTFDLNGHTYIRDAAQHYFDFLFVNRYGAVETVCAVTKESLSYPVKTTTHELVGSPSFTPSPSLMSIAEGTRGTWKMSSGNLTRAWLSWWATDFLRARRWWMRIGNIFYPVTVAPDKESVEIYDKKKQELHAVNFTVTLALEGRA